MVEMLETQMAAQILEVAQGLGFSATREPIVSDNRTSKLHLLGRLRHSGTMRPDLVIENAGKTVVIEVKRGQVLPGGVEQVLQYVDALDAKGVICVPDAVLPKIASSVTRYAHSTDIHICSMSEVGGILINLLSDPDTNTDGD